MKYWILASTALVGGFFLLNGALQSVLPLVSRVQLALAVVAIGGGRRMVQERLHARRWRHPGPGGWRRGPTSSPSGA